MQLNRSLSFLVIGLISLGSAAGHAAEVDARQFVEMPVEALAALRAEMIDFQGALNAIIGALAEQQFDQAADIAEKQIGMSAMGRHRSSPPNARPGMFMPNDMHGIARSMHGSASEFAKVAKTGDTAKALGALQVVTGACVACHRSYRTQ